MIGWHGRWWRAAARRAETRIRPHQMTTNKIGSHMKNTSIKKIVSYMKTNENLIYINSGAVGFALSILLFKKYIPINLWIYVSLFYLLLADFLSKKNNELNKLHGSIENKYMNTHPGLLTIVVVFRGFFLMGAIGFPFSIALTKIGF